MYLHQKVQRTYCVHIVLQNTFAAVGGIWVRLDRFGDTGRFKGELKCNDG